MESRRQKLKQLGRMATDFEAEKKKKEADRLRLQEKQANVLANPREGSSVELQRVLGMLAANEKEINALVASMDATTAEITETQTALSELEDEQAQREASTRADALDKKIDVMVAALLENVDVFRLAFEREILKPWASERPLLGDRHRVERRIGRIQGFLSYTEQGERNMRDLIGKV